MEVGEQKKQMIGDRVVYTERRPEGYYAHFGRELSEAHPFGPYEDEIAAVDEIEKHMLGDLDDGVHPKGLLDVILRDFGLWLVRRGTQTG
jgi:hypothetical protein